MLGNPFIECKQNGTKLALFICIILAWAALLDLSMCSVILFVSLTER